MISQLLEIVEFRRRRKKIVRVKMIPLVVGSFSAIPKQFGNRLKKTGIRAEMGKFRR